MITENQVLQAIPDVLTEVNLTGFGEKISGKVRDIYANGDQRILITTDRVSAFDRVLGAIPFKGQVLNQLSAWWFEQTKDIIPNHVIAVPDPNVTIGQEAESLPVEVVVRGYITGVTSTSLWTLYQQGERNPYGVPLPEGLRKNDPLPHPVITPTTKATGGAHDERLTRDEIVKGGLVDEALWQQVETAAIAIFQRGQAVAKKASLVLVDTKYEFGLIDGKLALIDEIHTPDSSRYWVEGAFGADGEPESFDKEFLRRWFIQQGYKGEGMPPTMPDEFIAQVALRYIAAFEKLTGAAFVPGEMPYNERIARNLASYQPVH
ncbi:MAG: phosphoribosylaminoimidazolesuccinocarboxamide synthase [Anaerolineaceae bacterium]|nr:phosphoribosylaminoimidazolesuccinocarboxamide synthase [Anaerolineaceae bacterium]